MIPRTPWHEDALTSFSTVNVTTCLAYVGAGGWIGWGWGDWYVGLSFVVLGVLSAVYHATRMEWANRWDYTGMVFVFGMLLTGGLPRGWMVGLSLGLAAIPWVVWTFREQLVALLIGALLAMVGWPIWPVAAVLLGLGFVAWILDVDRNFPAPRWGHGVWHLLTAAGLTVLYWGIYR